MNKILTLLTFTLILAVQNSFAQDENVRLGTPPRAYHQNGGYYDYSDPMKINIQVAIWGYVKLPGKYIVPINSSLRDLISFAGGPTSDALLQEVRLVRMGADSTQQVLFFNFNELLFEEKVTRKIEDVPLQPGDMVAVPGEPRFYFRDYVTMTLSIVSTLTSLTILVLNIVR